MVKRIIEIWKKRHGDLPRDYLCFDLETTGFKADDDLIVELGNCQVQDGQGPLYEGDVLNWFESDMVDDDWLEDKLETCRASMERAGRVYTMTPDRMQSEGNTPEIVLEKYVSLIEAAKEKKQQIVGHNIVKFDAKRFAQATEEWLGKRCEIPPELCFDTAAVEKASQLELEPDPSEPLHKYFKRILEYPVAGVRYNLDDHCVNKYKLQEKYDLPMEEAHTAGFDACLCHLLLEEFRRLANA